MEIIYGGTFDPPHRGHERFIDLMQARFPTAPVYLLPCYQSVHTERAQATAEQRLAMLKLVVRGRSRVSIDQRELDAGEPSYSVDTLTAWRSEVGPERSLVFAIGGDSLARLHSWARWHALFDLVHLLVLPRPGWDSELAPPIREALNKRWLSAVEMAQLSRQPSGHVMTLPGKALPWSSSQIRNSTEKRADALSPAVLNYINQHGLYGT